MLTTITTIIILGALIIASLFDIKTREVPDWLNYSLIVVGLSTALMYSLIFSDLSYIISSVLGLLLCVIVGFVMFYSAQWGGGDSKILFGLGALIGLELQSWPFLVNFLINSLIAGAIYGLLWSLVLVFKNWKKFTKEFSKISKHEKFLKLQRGLLLLIIASFISSFMINDLLFRFSIASITIMILFSFYLWYFIKAVETAVMMKMYDVDELTPGDWIVNNIKIDGKKIYSTKDLGVSEEQIKILKSLKQRGKITQLLVKEGVPFVPSFLIAFVMTLFVGNLILLFA